MTCSISFVEAKEPSILQPLDHGAWVAVDNLVAKGAESGLHADFLIGTDAVLVVDTFENAGQIAKKQMKSSAA